MAVVAPRAAGTGETVNRRGAVSTITAAAAGVSVKRITVRTITAGVTVGAIPDTATAGVTARVTVGATAGITVSGAANVTYDAVGPAIGVNPGVCRRCGTRDAAAAGVAVSPAPRLSRGRSGRRNCETRAKNRHRHVFSTVPHDLVSCGNCSKSAGLRDLGRLRPKPPSTPDRRGRSCFAHNRTL